ncbi:MAG: helix-turn-helix domain-containing protein [bacterium]|nr:helix-turn-helix domain-containing protein [bacterium]
MTKPLIKMIIEAEIGKRIRQHRLQNDFTLQELADRTGYSKGYLSKVEKSDKAPPVATLSVIARELGVSVSIILGEETMDDSICLVRQNERMLMAKNGVEFGYAYEALANPYPNKHMEPFILSYPSDDALKHTFQHDGEEMLFVLQGKIRFKYGSREFVLDKGDCVYFDSSVAHTGEPVGDKPLKTLIVLYTGSPKGPTSLEHIKRRIIKQ